MDGTSLLGYVAYGLGIRSALHLPELVSGDVQQDVALLFGSIERAEKEIGESPRLVCGTTQRVHLEWRGVGAFEVREGQEIVVDPLPSIEESVLRLFILGPALRILLLQRGLLVFHASVVGLSSGAVAFMAPQRHGKSTMAAALHSSGHRLVDDDVLVVEDDGDQLVVRPGFPQIKLRPDAAQAIGQDSSQLAVLHPQLERRAYRIRHGFSQDPLPLKGIYVLDTGDRPGAPALGAEIASLSPREALFRVLPNWYAAMFGPELLQMFGLDLQFGASMRLVDRVPIYSLTRPRSLDALPDVVCAVEQHVLGKREPIGTTAVHTLDQKWNGV